MKFFMAVFIVLWPYLLTTKLRCLQKKTLGALKRYYNPHLVYLLTKFPKMSQNVPKMFPKCAKMFPKCHKMFPKCPKMFSNVKKCSQNVHKMSQISQKCSQNVTKRTLCNDYDSGKKDLTFPFGPSSSMKAIFSFWVS